MHRKSIANYYFDLKREDFQDWIELNCKFYNFYSGIEFESDAVYSIKLNLHWIYFFSSIYIFICWRKRYTFILYSNSIGFNRIKAFNPNSRQI